MDDVISGGVVDIVGGQAFFGRFMAVTIVDPDSESITDTDAGITIIGLKMTAKIVKDSKTGEDDFCELQIYNLSEATRNKLNANLSRLEVVAGYGANTGVVFLGDIQSTTHMKMGQDWITNLIASDGAKALDQALLNKTYSAGTTLGDMLDDIKNVSKVETLTKVGIDEKKVLPRGKSINGNVRDVLTQLGNSNGFDWSMQDGEMVVVQVDKPRDNETIIVSAESGMIGSPEWINEGDDKEKTKTADGLKLKVISLCQQSIRPFDKIVIQSIALAGKVDGISTTTTPTEYDDEYKVTKVSFNLDSFDGDFTTEIECQLTGEKYAKPTPFDVSEL